MLDNTSVLDFAFWIMVAYAIGVIASILFINWYTTRNNKYPGRSPDVYEVHDTKEPDQKPNSASDALSNIRKFWSN